MSSEQYQLPIGFKTAGITAGIKESKLPDLALFASDFPAVAAGVFTQNQVVGAPVIVSRERVPASNVHAIVINSGNANACTGEQGITDARQMTAIVAEELNVEQENVLVCSTGVIGHFLPMEVVGRGIRSAAADLDSKPESLVAAAKAIMT
ncbi:MAG: arginine biosynthesis protein ArgJ, partial [Planctomicrobium sp.]|nr:arginine biosynthesis protein ArgJ [Planctomicrobium sp.]